MLPESVYRRLHENRWTAAEDRLTNVDDVRACACLDGPLDPMPNRHYVLALDLGLVNDRTVAAVLHSESVETDGRVIVQRHVLDRMATWQGSRRKPVDLGAVEGWVLTTACAFRAKVMVDPWQSQSKCRPVPFQCRVVRCEP